MTETVQLIYIRAYNFLYRKIVSKIPAQVRDILVLSIFIFIFLYFIYFRSEAHYQHLLKHIGMPHRIGGILLLIASVLSMKEELHVLDYGKSLVIPYVLLGAGIITIRLFHPLGAGYVAFGVLLLIVYPAFYLVWNNRGDYETLFDYIAFASILTGLIYFIWFVYYYFTNTFAEEERIKGSMYIANFLSFLGTCVACSALYYWYRSFRKELEHHRATAAFSLAGFFAGGALTIEGESRSGLLIIAGAIFVTLMLVLKNEVSAYTDKQKAKKWRMVLLLVVCAIFALLYALSDAGELSILQRFSPENLTPDQFSSGRLSIWHSYWSDLNLLGHDMTKVDWLVLSAGINTRHAHNTFLEFSYRLGLIVGIVFVIFHVSTIIATLRIMIKNERNRSYELFIAICMIHFTVHALIDIATLPFESYGPFLFYIAIVPLFLRSNYLPSAKKDYGNNEGD